MFAICIGIAAIGLTASPARATVILDVDPGTGQLLGAWGVEVGNTIYDVEFLDGSCVSLFTGCDNAAEDFAFTDRATAELTAAALLDQVLLDSNAGLFDSEPEVTNG